MRFNAHAGRVTTSASGVRSRRSSIGSPRPRGGRTSSPRTVGEQTGALLESATADSVTATTSVVAPTSIQMRSVRLPFFDVVANSMALEQADCAPVTPDFGMWHTTLGFYMGTPVSMHVCCPGGRT